MSVTLLCMQLCHLSQLFTIMLFYLETGQSVQQSFSFALFLQEYFQDPVILTTLSVPGSFCSNNDKEIKAFSTHFTVL